MVCLLDAVISLSVDIRRMGDGLRERIKTERFSKTGWFKESDNIVRCIIYLARQDDSFAKKCVKSGGRGLGRGFSTPIYTKISGFGTMIWSMN